MLEENGKISFLPYSDKRPANPSDFNIKPQEDGVVTNLILDGKVMEDNLKEIRLNNIKNKFKSGKYKYILCIDKEINNDVITELVDNYKAQTVIVDSLTLSLDEDDYFNIMNKFIENIKTVLS